MFFWGSYNFNAHQLQEDEGKPPLKFPIHVPPSPSTLTHLPLESKINSQAGEHDSKGQLSELRCQQIRRHAPLKVLQVAAGTKHLLALIATPLPSDNNNNYNNNNNDIINSNHESHQSENPNMENYTLDVYGLGSNHSGQLGHLVGTHTSTLINLRIIYPNTISNSNTNTGARANTYAENNATSTTSNQNNNNTMNVQNHLLSRGITVLQIACNQKSSFILSSAGIVYAAGDNTVGQLGVPLAACANTASLYFSKRNAQQQKRLKNQPINKNMNSGNCCCTRFTPVLNLVHIEKIFVGPQNCFALDDKNNIYCWGNGKCGQLGLDHLFPQFDLQTYHDNFSSLLTRGHHNNSNNNDNNNNQGGLLKQDNFELYHQNKMTFDFESEKEENDFYCVWEPTLLTWFARHKIHIIEIAVGKTHTLFLGCQNYLKQMANSSAHPHPFHPQHNINSNPSDLNAEKTLEPGSDTSSSVFHNQLQYTFMTDVYVCGDNTYGKLGLGHTNIVPLPVRLEHYFPKHFHAETSTATAAAGSDGSQLNTTTTTTNAMHAIEKEVIVSIAASDDASFILKQNAVLGSLVYFCGRQNNKDGQLAPLQMQTAQSYYTCSQFFPLFDEDESENKSGFQLSSSRDVVSKHNNQFYKLCGSKGNQVFIITNFGEVLMCGNHTSPAVTGAPTSYFDYYSGAPASAKGVASQPRIIKSLLPFQITDVAVGGTFVVSYCAYPLPNVRHNQNNSNNNINNNNEISEIHNGSHYGDQHCAVYNNNKGQLKFGLRCKSDVQQLLKLNYLDEPPKAEKTDGDEKENENNNKLNDGWDIIIAHNDRVSKLYGQSTNDVAEEKYEKSRFLFLKQYFDESHTQQNYAKFKEQLKLNHTNNNKEAENENANNNNNNNNDKVHSYASITENYLATIPAAPSLSEKLKYKFDKIKTAEMEAGQKVRLWMTDVYALGTVTKVIAVHNNNNNNCDEEEATATASKRVRVEGDKHTNNNEEEEEERKENSPGGHNNDNTNDQNNNNHVRVLIEWQRDDWDDEEISLYSVDETLSSQEGENKNEVDNDNNNNNGSNTKQKRIMENRWQPFWFEKNEEGECFVERGAKKRN